MRMCRTSFIFVTIFVTNSICAPYNNQQNISTETTKVGLNTNIYHVNNQTSYQNRQVRSPSNAESSTSINQPAYGLSALDIQRQKENLPRRDDGVSITYPKYKTTNEHFAPGQQFPPNQRESTTARFHSSVQNQQRYARQSQGSSYHSQQYSSSQLGSAAHPNSYQTSTTSSNYQHRSGTNGNGYKESGSVYSQSPNQASYAHSESSLHVASGRQRRQAPTKDPIWIRSPQGQVRNAHGVEGLDNNQGSSNSDINQAQPYNSYPNAASQSYSHPNGAPQSYSHPNSASQSYNHPNGASQRYARNSDSAASSSTVKPKIAILPAYKGSTPQTRAKREATTSGDSTSSSTTKLYISHLPDSQTTGRYARRIPTTDYTTEASSTPDADRFAREVSTSTEKTDSSHVQKVPRPHKHTRNVEDASSNYYSFTGPTSTTKYDIEGHPVTEISERLSRSAGSQTSTTSKYYPGPAVATASKKEQSKQDSRYERDTFSTSGYTSSTEHNPFQSEIHSGGVHLSSSSRSSTESSTDRYAREVSTSTDYLANTKFSSSSSSSTGRYARDLSTSTDSSGSERTSFSITPSGTTHTNRLIREAISEFTEPSTIVPKIKRDLSTTYSLSGSTRSSTQFSTDRYAREFSTSTDYSADKVSSSSTPSSTSYTNRFAREATSTEPSTTSKGNRYAREVSTSTDYSADKKSSSSTTSSTDRYARELSTSTENAGGTKTSFSTPSSTSYTNRFAREATSTEPSTTSKRNRYAKEVSSSTDYSENKRSSSSTPNSTDRY